MLAEHEEIFDYGRLFEDPLILLYNYDAERSQCES